MVVLLKVGDIPGSYSYLEVQYWKLWTIHWGEGFLKCFVLLQELVN